MPNGNSIRNCGNSKDANPRTANTAKSELSTQTTDWHTNSIVRKTMNMSPDTAHSTFACVKSDNAAIHR